MFERPACTPCYATEVIMELDPIWFTQDKHMKAIAKELKRLEDMLFAAGAMDEAPCFCCGYNGPGYYQPAQHKCAKRHHKLVHNAKLSGGESGNAA